MREGETFDSIEGLADGLTDAVFAYRWVRQDPATRTDADIEGATSSTYTVTDADEGKAIKVRVTFDDDAGNAESLTSDARLFAPPLAIPKKETPPESTKTAETPLTAAIHDAPESHDGEKRFTFELRFSEDPKEDFSYKTLRDHAFTVTGGEVAGARRLDGDSDTRNIKWEISVTPDSERGRHRRAARHRGLRRAGGHLHRGRQGAVQPAEIHRQGASADGKFRERPNIPHRQRRIQIQNRLQRGTQIGLQLHHDARPCLHGDRRLGNRRAKAGQRQEPPMGDRRQPGLQRGRDDHSARHHGLRRAGGHLRRRRQEAVQPPGAHRQRAWAVMDNEKSKHRWTGEASVPTGNRSTQSLRRTGKGMLALA